MDIVEQRYLIKASPEKVWAALTDEKIIEKWGAGPARMKDEIGFEFSLWGGDVYGKNLEVVNPKKGEKKLVQEWFGGEWEIPSIVTFKINGDGQKTEVLLIHKDMPKSEADDLAEGWRDYYMEPIKKLLEAKE